MRLLISDANVLIDVEAGDLLHPMFSLDYLFTVPDVLYFEELEEQHAHLLALGLEVRSLSEKGVKRVQELAQTHRRPSRNDLFALALAEVEKCPLLTGDAALREAAQAEKIEVKGTIWLVSEMLNGNFISFETARAAFDNMRAKGRRLPWKDAERIFRQFERK